MTTIYGAMSVESYLRISGQKPAARWPARRLLAGVGVLLLLVGALGGWSFGKWNGQGSQLLTRPQAVRELANVENPQAMRETALARVYILVKYTHLALKASGPRDYQDMSTQLRTSLVELLAGDGNAADRVRTQLAAAGKSEDPDIGDMSSGVSAIVDAYAQPALRESAGVYMKRLSTML